MAINLRFDSDREPPPNRAGHKGADPADVDATIEGLAATPDQWAELSPEEGWGYGFSASWAIRLRVRAPELGHAIEVDRWRISGRFRRPDCRMAVKARVLSRPNDQMADTSATGNTVA